jgi:hypothetical protein
MGLPVIVGSHKKNQKIQLAEKTGASNPERIEKPQRKAELEQDQETSPFLSAGM